MKQEIEITNSLEYTDFRRISEKPIEIRTSQINTISAILLVSVLITYLIYSDYYILTGIITVILCAYVFSLQKKRILFDTNYLYIRDVFSQRKIETSSIGNIIIITYKENEKSIVSKDNHAIIVHTKDNREHVIRTDDFNQKSIIKSFETLRA